MTGARPGHLVVSAAGPPGRAAGRAACMLSTHPVGPVLPVWRSPWALLGQFKRVPGIDKGLAL